ncbi:hypothetical protein [Synechocystis sp. LKSZ1]|uniref:hypothetical protein n=1 Tax=Synechocystis sp. LKSZ1 TaxID=3144951 RepID=UPI00336BF9A0
MAPTSRLLAIFLGVSASVSLFALPGQAQISQAVVQEIIDGNQVYIQEIPAKVDDKADFGQVVLTKESRASLAFNNGAAGRLGHNASVTVGQCVEVQQGELLISGPVNGCVAGITVAVKGTVYVLQKQDDKSGTVKVVEGTVQVTTADKPGETVEVKAGEQISILRGILGSVIPMTPEEIVALLSGQLFSGFQIPVTPDGLLQSACSRLLPGLSCSTTGLPSYPVPSLPVPISIPGLPF